jgi:hypothetical protein
MANPKIAEQIENAFRYHRPIQDAQKVMKELRAQFRDLAHVINEVVPDGHEKALALTNLEQAQFWSNAGITRSYPVTDD